MTYSLFEYAKENAEDLITVTETQPQEQVWRTCDWQIVDIYTPPTCINFSFLLSLHKHTNTHTHTHATKQPTSAARATEVKTKKEKKEVLSKQAKRRMADRTS